MSRTWLAVVFLAGCSLGDVTAPPPEDPGDDAPPTGTQQTLVDGDGDGVPDGIDTDGDGVPDIDLEDICIEPLIDADGDGVPEGIDFNCDGVADLELPDLEDLPTDPLDCLPAPIDADGDGWPDGIDVDCDGVADFTF